MDFKILILSIACFAFFIQPAQSGRVASIAFNAIRNLTSIGSTAVQTKAVGVVKGVSGITSVMATGIGLNVKALAQASSSSVNAVGDAFVGVGDTIQNAGDQLVAGKPGSSSRMASTRTVEVSTPRVEKEEDIVVPCEPENVMVPVDSVPLRTVMRVRQPAVQPRPRLPIVSRASSVFSTLRNAARSKIGTITGGIFRGLRTPPPVYEIVETPRVIQGPLYETIRIQKK